MFANVADFLLAGKPSNRICMQFLQEEHTYGELDLASRRIAQKLSMRTSRGDRVILVAGNSFFWVAAYLGIIRAGLVCVPLPPAIAAPDLESILRSTEAKVAFVHSRHVETLGASLNRLECFTERQSLADTGEPWEAAAAVSPDDLAALMYTSGSTGKPRGVMISHRNIIANTESIIQYLQLTREDRIMAVLPFYYCFGASLLHTHFRAGGSLVIDSRFMYPEVILRRMRETRCTGFAGVPSHFQILLRKSSLRRQHFPELRYVQQAGGHLAPVFVQQLSEALPGVKVFLMYGQTEATARLSYLSPEWIAMKPGSVGRGIPGVTLRVIDENGEETRPGAVGEIVAQGDNVAQGYWRDPEITAQTFRGGRLYTGDLATIDGEGYLYIVDRARDVIKCGGNRVSSRRIEDHLLEMDAIVEAAVIGIADNDLGEAVKAFIVPATPDRAALREEIREYCRARMPAEWVPRRIVVLDALPKNSAGKVLKSVLRGLDEADSGSMRVEPAMSNQAADFCSMKLNAERTNK